DIFWGLIASFWIGNVILIVLNVPMIGVWVKMLQVPYRYLFPSAMFFIAVGVFSTQNSLFQIWEVLAFGLIGALLMVLDFSVAPIMLGFVLGPMVEENFRRALLLSRGDLRIFIDRPISATFVAISVLLVLGVTWSALRGKKRGRPQESVAEEVLASAHVAQASINKAL
ncbi:MAG TPA: tripartite tricarboxylate transporter permease, partial [Burkholderiaceae bacterium]